MDGNYSYEYEYDSYYCYLNSYVLKNKLNIENAEELVKAEREITSIRTAQALLNRIEGNFDFEHLKKIHQFLFGDIYEWAGKVRTVNISKGNQFCRCEFIQDQMDVIFNNLREEDYLRKYTDKEKIAKKLAYYLGEINAIHPFREGNGRCQRMFIEHLCYLAGYRLDFIKITEKEMLEASVKAFDLEYDMMEQLISEALSKE